MHLFYSGIAVEERRLGAVSDSRNCNPTHGEFTARKETNMIANVKYILSAAGQKAALIAGRTATRVVTETMEFTDVTLIDKLDVRGDGSLHYDRSGWGSPELDTPPAELTELIGQIESYRDAEKAKAEALEAERKHAEKVKAEADFPVVEALLADYESLSLDAECESRANTIANGYYTSLSVTAEQRARFAARYQARKEYADRIQREAEEAKAAARAAMIAEHGGIVFPVEAGMCTFKGQNLWSGGQSKRWVGIFTAPKGIDTFCDSPRGEFVFSVAGLNRGDCIQGAGYDTNSRGKRRSETEWFGVVVRRDESSIVVDLHGSRAATLKAASKL